MRVLFDHQIFSYQRFGGASRYFAELMRVFHEQGDPQFDLGVATSPNAYLAAAQYYRGRTTGAIAGTPRFFATYARNVVQTRLAARRPHDVFHATFYSPDALGSARGSRLVVTVLDMIPERFPEAFDLHGLYGRFVTKRWIETKRVMCERAAGILAISENTKQDIVELYGIPAERIVVTHLGNRLTGSREQAKPRGFPDRYVLFVGTRNTYKNFGLVLEALAQIPDVALACIGGGPFDDGEKARIAKHGLGDRVTQRNVSDDEMGACYAHAEAFVFPSRYEGFGIPILEAFACGCPALLARASCFPEIAGDAALYFDPDEADELRAALVRVLEDRTLADRLRALGHARARELTWESTAARTAAAYRDMVGRSP
ncbi:MAG TPA: glycosyltransferase family 1 protein [Kofleriaceae bacterium]|nr:glycosyltransferase family 1 protein [Kofleriaceae bacterium]